MKKEEKTESIEDIFDHLKTIVNEPETKSVGTPKKTKPSGGMKLGIIILLIVLLLGIVIGGYFVYKANANPNTESPLPVDENQTILDNGLTPIFPGPNNDDPNNNNNNWNNGGNTPDNNTNTGGDTNDDDGDNGRHHGGTTTDPCSNLGTVNFNPAPGVYLNTISVALNYSKSGCDFNIHYTINGTTPTSSSPRYISPITVSSTTAIKAIIFAKKRNGTIVNGNIATGLFVINRDPCEGLGAVVFDHDNGTYTNPISLKLTYEHPKDKCIFSIRYTIDGTNPTKESPEYTRPIDLTYGTTYVKAAVFAKNLNNQSINGPIETKRYIINQTASDPCENLGAVHFNPDTGTYTEPITVDLTYTHVNNECEFSIRYTTDGTDPTSTSLKYTGGGIRISETTTIKAAVFSASKQGPISEKKYTINIPVNPCANLGEVTFNPKGATYSYTPIALYLGTNNINPDCMITIHYTTDGSEPKTYSPEYYPNSGISLAITENESITVKARIFSNTVPQYEGPTSSETYRYVPEVINK